MHKLTFYDVILRQAPDAPVAPPVAPPPPPDPGAPPPAPPPAAAWYEAHPDPVVKTFLTEQQIGDANVAATKLYHATKALGGSTDIIVKPPADATPEQRAAFFDALGRPKEAAAYDFGLPPEVQVDQGFQDWAKSAFHEVGIPADQAKGLVGKWQQFVADHNASQVAATQLKEEAVIADLKKVHGAQFDQFVADGQKAFNALGLPEEQANALASQAGSAAFLSLMSALGKKMGGEGGFVSPGGGQGELSPDQMTPAAAGAEINRLMADAVFQAKYNDARNPEHAVAVERMKKLFERAEPKS